MQVIFFKCRGGYYPPLCFTGLSCCFASLSVKFASQTFRRQPLPICAIFVILIVGATSGRPSFIKISLHLARVVEAPTLPVCARLIFLIVGATTMFSKKTCGLPSNRPWTVNLRSKYGRTVPTDLYDICYFDCRGDSRIAREQNVRHTRW